MLLLLGCAGRSAEEPEDPYSDLIIASLSEVAWLGAAEDGTLYASTHNILGRGAVWRLAAGETAFEKLLPTAAMSLALSDTHVYFFAPRRGAGSPGLVGRISLATGEVEHYVTEQYAMGVAVDDESVYWLLGGSAGGLYRAPQEGGEPTRLVAHNDVWGQLLIDETHAYWITTYGITRLSKQGGELEDILPAGAWQAYVDAPPIRLALHGEHLYWVAGAGYNAERGGLAQMTKDGSDVTLLAAEQPNAAAVAVDDSHVYWSRGFDGSCELVRMPLQGGPEEVLVTGQNDIYAIALTSDTVIWVNRFRSTIYALSKP